MIRTPRKFGAKLFPDTQIQQMGLLSGVDARKVPPRDIDAASGLRLLSDPHAFESRLRDWIRDATNPPIMGVEYQSYANEGGEGFVVCLIPESIHKPHRAEYAEQQYYFRVGDDFLITPPSLLRTLFYPQKFPYLWFEVELLHQFNPSDLGENYRKNPTSADSYNHLVNKGDSSLNINVHLHNSGSATAREVYIVVLVNYDLSYNPGVDWKFSEHPDGQAAFLAKRSIHPGEISHLFYGAFQQTFRNVSINPSNSWELFPNFETINLRFHVYADNFQQEEIMLEFQPSDLSFKDGFVQKIGKPIV